MRPHRCALALPRLPGSHQTASQATSRPVSYRASSARAACCALVSMANARQKLNELCTQRKLKWEYVKDAPPQQAAIKLHCAPEPITFTAAGANKKAQQEAAAEQALQYLLTGALPGGATAQGSPDAPPAAPRPPPAVAAEPAAPVSITAAIANALKASPREAACHGHHLQSKLAWEGWVPLFVLLAVSKAARNAAKRAVAEAACLPADAHPTAHLHALAKLLAAEQDELAEHEAQQVQQAPEPAQQAPNPATNGDTEMAAAVADAEPKPAAPAAPPGAPPLQVSGAAVRLKPGFQGPLHEVWHEYSHHPPAAATPTTGRISVTAVLIRADSSATPQPLQTVTFTSHGHLLGQVVAALLQGRGTDQRTGMSATAQGAAGAPAASQGGEGGTAVVLGLAYDKAAPAGCGELVSYDAVGMKWSKVMWPSSQPHQPQQQLQQNQPQQQLQQNQPQQPRAAGSGEGGTAQQAKGKPARKTATAHTEPQEPPHMYGLLPAEAGGGQVNVLASWLAGQAVYGDVVVTACRPRNKMENRRPVFRWASFTPTDLVLALGAVTPTMRLALGKGAPLLTRLPHTYTTANAWQGAPPKDLLQAYCDRQLRWQGFNSTPLVYERLSTQEVDTGAQQIEPAAAASVDEGSLEESEFEVGEGSGPVGFVRLKGPYPALIHTAHTTPTALSVKEPVARNNTPEWEASEQRAALRMLYMLHDADAAAIRTLLQYTPDFSPACTTPTNQPITGVQPPTDVDMETDMEKTDENVAMEDVDAAPAAAEPMAGVVAGGVVGGGAAVVARPGTMPSVACQVWLYPVGVLPPQQGVGVGERAVGAKRERDNSGEDMGPRGVPLTETEGGDAEHKAQAADKPILAESTKVALQVGSGGVPVEVETAVPTLRMGGSTSCRLQLPLAGPDPFGLLPLTHAVIRITLESVYKPALAPPVQSRPLFRPPLGQQRAAAVLDVCDRHNATAVADIGCGDGALLAAFCAAPAWRARLAQYTGVDISRGALTRAGKKSADTLQIDRAAGAADTTAGNAANATGTATGGMGDVASVFDMPVVWECEAGAVAPACKLLYGSAFQEGLRSPEAWGDLHGVEVATLMEVVEHLDPEPLSLLGPCLLGGLRPKVLVVSTPNWDYNAVMRRAEARSRAEAGIGSAGGAWPGPPGRDGLPLRCSDHRFEWTESEFREWAQWLASEFGYSVELTGVGQVENAGPEDKGYSTQLAVFTLAAE